MRYISIHGVILFFLTALIVQAAPAKKPNILIYLSDDHLLLDSSVYGATDIPTPNMEKLAAAGLTFNRAFVASPACAPSRAAMLTGLMPARNGAEANHTYARPGTKRLPAYLHELGYEVVAFGKIAHGNDVTDCGFDSFKKNAEVQVLGKNVTEFLTQRKSTKPLCLFVGTSNPHVPWPAKTSFDPAKVILPPKHIDTPETRAHRAMYYQEIKDLDILLGDLMQLSNQYLGSETIMMYSSDHGAQWPFGKWNLYDAGIRCPLIIAWPGVTKPNTQTEAMVSWIDFLPTLIEIGGGQPPLDIDGQSFVKVLNNPQATHRDRIYTTHSGDGDKNVYPIRSLRTEQYKYIWNLHPEYAHTNHSDLLLKPGAGAYWRSWEEKAKTDPEARAIMDKYHQRPSEELYDITKDPWEENNLAEQPEFQALKKEMRHELEKWMEEQGDQRTVFNTPRPLNKPETYAIGADINK